MGALVSTDPSPAVLHNRGVPVKVHRVEAGSGLDRWDRVFDDNDGPVLDQLFVHFTALSMSDLEERYGDLDGWQKALEDAPYRALVDTFAIVWEVDRRQAGKMLLDDSVDDYAAAIGAAFMLAQGAEPDAVVRVLRAGVKSARAQKSTALANALKEAEASGDDTQTSPADGSPGLSGSEDGSRQDEESTSSGD